MVCNSVAKFGGTSVKTASSIRAVFDIVSNNPNIRAVVVSAVGGVTNDLVAFCHASCDERQSLLDKILQTHLDLARDLSLSLDDHIQKAHVRLDQVKDLDHLDDKAIDHIVSLGEDMSSLIVAHYFKSQDVSITLLDARDFMKTDDVFGKAAPHRNIIATYTFPTNLFITQGFIGSTHQGETTTLGRGGSDYSAALIAEAMKADELMIYTDVPGVYTMDPNRIEAAHPIPEMTFQEMAEMANFGAKILHPATLEPCVCGGVPIRILSTFEPLKEGTLITVDHREIVNESHIRAITMRQGQVLVTIKSLNMLNAYGFLANIFSILARYKISVDLITTSEVSVALTIDGMNGSSHDRNPFLCNESLLKDLHAFADVTLEEDLTLIAVVGYGLRIPGVIQRILSGIESHKIRLMCYGASNSSVGILVPRDEALPMTKILHAHLLEEERNLHLLTYPYKCAEQH